MAFLNFGITPRGKISQKLHSFCPEFRENPRYNPYFSVYVHGASRQEHWLVRNLDIGKILPKRRKTPILLSMQRFRFQLKYKNSNSQLSRTNNLQSGKHSSFTLSGRLQIQFPLPSATQCCRLRLDTETIHLYTFLFSGITLIQTTVIFAHQLAYLYFWVIGG